jgi:TRAP-type C4-dicarboxylate transport system substrate-binding protein
LLTLHAVGWVEPCDTVARLENTIIDADLPTHLPVRLSIFFSGRKRGQGGWYTEREVMHMKEIGDYYQAETAEQKPSRRLIPISRRQFGQVAAAFGFHAAFGAWYMTLRDGEIPTLDRVVAQALGISEAQAAKPPKYKFRHGTNLTRKSEEVQKVGLWEFAEDVAKRTDGEVQIEIVGGGALCAEVTCPQKVAGKVVDIGTNSSQNAAPTFPYYNVLDYAFLWPSRASLFHFLYSPKSETIFRKTVREKYGIEWLWSHVELRNVFLGLKYKARPLVKKPEEIRGTKLRITGSQMGRIALAQFGANPVPVAWEETLEGLKSGLIDGQETWTSAAAAFGMGPVLAQEVWVEFFAGLSHTYTRTDVLARLPGPHREAVMEAAFTAQQWTQKHNEEALVKVVGINDPPPAGSVWAQTGVKHSKLTKEERQVWIDMASPQKNPKAWDEWRDKLTKIAGFDAYPELYKLAREIPEDIPATAVKPRRWWKET